MMFIGHIAAKIYYFEFNKNTEKILLTQALMALSSCRVASIVQRIIQYVSLAFFTTVPLSGILLLVHSFIVGRSPLLATFEIDFLFPGGVAMSEPFDPLHSIHLMFGMAPYDKIVIAIVERDTWETSLVHCHS